MILLLSVFGSSVILARQMFTPIQCGYLYYIFLCPQKVRNYELQMIEIDAPL